MHICKPASSLSKMKPEVGKSEASLHWKARRAPPKAPAGGKLLETRKPVFGSGRWKETFHSS